MARPLPVASTTAAYAKTPASTEGKPVNVFVAKRATRASDDAGPSSARKTAARTPTGIATRPAMPTITMVPTTALPKPPPGSNPAGGSSTNTARPSRAPPRTTSM
jgi:hypothetical protein